MSIPFSAQKCTGRRPPHRSSCVSASVASASEAEAKTASTVLTVEALRALCSSSRTEGGSTAAQTEAQTESRARASVYRRLSACCGLRWALGASSPSPSARERLPSDLASESERGEGDPPPPPPREARRSEGSRLPEPSRSSESKSAPAIFRSASSSLPDLTST